MKEEFVKEVPLINLDENRNRHGNNQKYSTSAKRTRTST